MTHNVADIHGQRLWLAGIDCYFRHWKQWWKLRCVFKAVGIHFVYQMHWTRRLLLSTLMLIEWVKFSSYVKRYLCFELHNPEAMTWCTLKAFREFYDNSMICKRSAYGWPSLWGESAGLSNTDLVRLRYCWAGCWANSQVANHFRHYDA